MGCLWPIGLCQKIRLQGYKHMYTAYPITVINLPLISLFNNTYMFTVRIRRTRSLYTCIDRRIVKE